jgi:hypothetical protein
VSDATAALARTVQLIAHDVYNVPNVQEQDRDLESAILAGLHNTTIRLVADRDNLSSPAGQTALVTLFGQIAMMGIGIDLVMSRVPVVAPQPPLRGEELRAALLDYGADAIPDARVGTDLGEPDLTFVLGDTDWPSPQRVFSVSGDAWRAAILPGLYGSRWRGTWPISTASRGQ